MVDENFKEWLDKQERLGKKFTKEQLEWLKMIKNHISTSLSVNIDEFHKFNKKQCQSQY
jgi:type I restriction enzyme, R subunit